MMSHFGAPQLSDNFLAIDVLGAFSSQNYDEITPFEWENVALQYGLLLEFIRAYQKLAIVAPFLAQ